MLIDRCTKIVLISIAVSVTALAANTIFPLREMADLFRPAHAVAQLECPAIAKGTVPRDHKLVGAVSFLSSNPGQPPEPFLVFETGDAYWFVFTGYYKNLQSGSPGCLHLKVNKG